MDFKELEDLVKVIQRWASSSAVCRVASESGFWFRFVTQAKQAFHPFAVGELVQGLFWKDKMLAFHWLIIPVHC